MKFGSFFIATVTLIALTACGGAERADIPPTDSGIETPAGVPLSPEAPATPSVPGTSNPAASAASPSDPVEVAGAEPSRAEGLTTPRPAGETAPAPAPAPSLPTGSAAPPPPAPAGVDANDILQRAERAYDRVRSMEADFVQEVYVPLLQSTQHSRGKIFSRMPDRFLMRFSEPQGDVIVADGRYVWMYYPSNDPRQVMRSTLSQTGQQVDLQREFLSNATQRYSAVRTGSETLDGRQTHALTLTPRVPSPYTRVRLWVDAQDFLVRQFEIVEQNETVRKLRMSGLRPDVALSDDLFRFTPPPGAQIFEP